MLSLALLAAAVGLAVHVLGYRFIDSRRTPITVKQVDLARILSAYAWLILVGNDAWEHDSAPETYLYGFSVFCLTFVLSEIGARILVVLTMSLDALMASLLGRVRR